MRGKKRRAKSMPFPFILGEECTSKLKLEANLISGELSAKVAFPSVAVKDAEKGAIL